MAHGIKNWSFSRVHEQVGNWEFSFFFFFLNFLYIYFFFLKQSLQSPDWSLGDALAVYPEH